MQIPGYRDLTVLGRGGFSTVYRALQESVQRDVALKVLAVHMAGADAKARFRRECASNGRVGTHPNIVTLFDSGFADDGSPYLAMQLCGGGSLSERLRAGGPLPIADVLRIGVKISAALQYAHSAGVLHRDIKPENILISDFGEPELADFGISSVDDQRLSTVTASSFTINHAAPETLAGEPSSVSSDVYSLASTLYTVTAGRTPFTAPAATALVALVNQVMNTPAPPTGRPDVPASLERLLAAGLSKTPAGRPADARAVGTALQGIQQELGLPVTEFPSAPPPLASAPTQTFAAIGDQGPRGGVGAGAVAAGAVAAGAVGGAAAGAATAGGAALAAAVGTGAIGAGAVDTGALPPTGALPAAQAFTGPATAGSGAAGGSTGQWGAWAATVGASPYSADPAADRSALSPASTPSPASTLSPASTPPSGAATPPGDPGGPSAAVQATGPGDGRRRWWIWSAVAATVIVVAVVVYFLAFHNSGNPGAGVGTAGTSTRATSSAAPTHSSPPRTTAATTTSRPTTSASTSTTTPIPPGASIDAFGSTAFPDGTVSCPSAGAVVQVPLAWSAANATSVWLGVDSPSGDASIDPYRAGLPAVVGPGHTPSSVDVPFSCSQHSHDVYLTVLGSAGKVTKHLTFVSSLPRTTASTTTTAPTTTSTTPTTTSSGDATATSTTTTTTPTQTTTTATTATTTS